METKDKKDKKKVLLVVDVQKEFADTDGQYERIIDFVNNTKDYDFKIATWCINSVTSPFFRYGAWTDGLQYPMPLQVEVNKVIVKDTYGLTDYSEFDRNNHYDIIGFNTDACVFKIAADLFDLNYDISILTDYCYSSNGKEHHEDGVKIMKRLFGSAVK